MKLEKRAGYARKVRFATEVSGSGGEHGSVSTSHIASFELDGLPVQVTAPRPVTLEEGDEVVIAGRLKNGVFAGLASFNRTRGVLESQSWLLGMIIGVILVAISAAILVVSTYTADDLDGVVGGLMGGSFVGMLGLVFWGASSRARQAERLVKRDSVTRASDYQTAIGQ